MGKGFATKGVKGRLEFAFQTFELTDIKSIYPSINLKSENVMIKICMRKVKEFKQSLLSEYKILKSVHCMK
jgi:RimJ/RimL family protein N-acetyltransferase